ncbi:hypothetical protein FRC14_007809 [Serendipita sp. 396]|nr:hypothetical protein FRC14_007809 [Serendipita sp. 396]KAG8776213.1 hypothetical protein FRC15_012059 [Serendipita sp. 397]
MSTCPYSKTAGGCRRNHCRLLHQNPENAQRGPTASAKSPTSKPRRPQTKTGAPNGVCKFYFAGESCKRNSCTYRHTEPDGASVTKQRGSGAPSSSSHRGANKAPTLAERSLEPAGFSPIPASKALYQLSIICASGSVLTKPAQIMKFVNLLANASSKDSGWVSTVILDTPS